MRANSRNQAVHKLVIFLGFFPFVSPVPTSSDLQPMFFLLAAALLATNPNVLRVHKFFVPLILFAFYQLLPIQTGDNGYMLGSRLGGIFSVIAALFFYVYRHRVTPDLVYAALIVHLVCGIFNYAAPSTWASIVGPFFHEFRAESVSFRGAGGANPEAGFLGAFGATFMGLGLYFFDAGLISRRKLIQFLLASTALVILSKSGAGVFMFALVVCLYILSRLDFKKAILAAVGMLAFSVVIDTAGSGEGNRGLELLIRVIQNPSLAIVSDVSLMLRVAPILAGLNTLYDGNVIGFGPGTFDSVSYSVLSSGNMQISQTVIDRILDSGGGASAIGRLIVEFGLIGFLLIALSVVRLVNIRYLFISFLPLSFILGSFSFSFPLTWLIFALVIPAKSVKRR